MALKTLAAPDLNDAPAAQALQQRHGNWSLRLPRQPDGLWDSLLDLDADSRAVLFAYCAAATVNALSQSYNRRPRDLAHADRLVTLTGLDMAQAWRPTVDTYPGGSRRRRSWTRCARPRARPRPSSSSTSRRATWRRSRAPARPGAWPIMSHTVGPRPGRTHHPAVPGARTASRPPRRCLPASTRAYALPATSPCQARAWMQRWLWLHVSATQPRRRPTSRQAAGRHQGRRDRPSVNLRRSIED